MSPDRIANKRKIYNILDLMGDVGGLNGALSQMCTILLFIYGSDYSLNSYLISKLFTKSSYQERKFTETSDVYRAKTIV